MVGLFRAKRFHIAEIYGESFLIDRDLMEDNTVRHIPIGDDRQMNRPLVVVST